ncbi:O-antigen ligase family protein [Bifidobacterium platyrrhinorum]|uniref:O-antigen ligase-related domain-containing protein n=1 Tax=Bifidobacterium platyrrhinorum TaxID=2661628 RepID=A0A6L9SVG5_9BIFI|nr:O-antigen ligase family protein [Bifidobacterium platyrrhinorum]NEG55141.1 hypothetical protein [Bifidobacterium platyrrhinorum]
MQNPIRMRSDGSGRRSRFDALRWIENGLSFPISLFDILMLLSFLGLFAPVGMGIIGMQSVAYRMQLIGIAATGALACVAFRRIKLDAVFFLTLAMCVTFFVPTMMYGDLSQYYIKTLLYFLQLWCVMNIGVHSDSRKMLRIALLVLSLIVIANALFMVVNLPSHPDGFSDAVNLEMWPLGHKNQFRDWFFPLVVTAVLLDLYKSKRPSFGTVLLMIVVVWCAVSANSATSTTILTLCCLIAVLYAIGVIKGRFFNSFVGLGIYATVFVFCVLLRRVPLLSDFITHVLKRDMTFTGRAEIWDTAMRRIAERPLLGRGYHDISTTELVTPYGQIVTHAHDALLDTLYKYGVVGFAVVAVLVLVCIWKLYDCRNSPIAIVITIFLTGFLVCGVFGELYDIGFHFILYLGFYSRELLNPSNMRGNNA